MLLVAVDLRDVVPAAIEERVVILVAILGLGPVVEIWNGRLFSQPIGDGLANGVEPIGDGLELGPVALGNGAQIGIDTLDKIGVVPLDDLDLHRGAGLVIDAIEIPIELRPPPPQSAR